MNKLVKVDAIKDLIFELRGQKVMLDKDIARLYGVSTKALNQAVKRNIHRFPGDFMFQISSEEWENLMFQNGTSNLKYQIGTSSDVDPRSQFATSRWGGVRKLPYAFTRNGVNMLAAVLRSKTAIDRSIFIMRAFSALEEAMSRRKNQLYKVPI
jgi:hypothetical protein